MTTNLDLMEKAYMKYRLHQDEYGILPPYEILDHLPDGISLTAGELDNDYAVCDISHWTQEDLEEFDAMGAGDQFAVIEAIEFGEFARGLRGEG
jgi:hypothetical protein